MSWDTAPLLLQSRMGSSPTLAYRVFPPSSPAKMAVVMSHGYFENMKRYRQVIERWNELGLYVAIYDLRGHGLSEGERGFISRFDEYVEDLLWLLDQLRHDTHWNGLGLPVLFGHSTGGLITLRTALRAPERIAGIALSSPYLGVAEEVPALKMAAGKLLSRLVPKVSLPTGMKGSDCTRSVDIAEAYEQDPMNFKKVNVRWFTETTAAQRQTLDEAPKLQVPLFCLQGGADKVGVADITDRFMARTSSVERHYERLPGVYHEILNEPERTMWIEQFAEAILGFRPLVADSNSGG